MVTNAQSQRREFALLCIRRRGGGGIAGRIFLCITGKCGQGCPESFPRLGGVRPAIRDTYVRNRPRLCDRLCIRQGFLMLGQIQGDIRTASRGRMVPWRSSDYLWQQSGCGDF